MRVLYLDSSIIIPVIFNDPRQDPSLAIEAKHWIRRKNHLITSEVTRIECLEELEKLGWDRPKMREQAKRALENFLNNIEEIPVEPHLLWRARTQNPEVPSLYQGIHVASIQRFYEEKSTISELTVEFLTAERGLEKAFSEQGIKGRLI